MTDVSDPDNPLFYRVLFIGKTWPESSASAAGMRTLELLRLLGSQARQMHFACAAQPSAFADHLEAVTCHQIALNEDGFDAWVKELNPSLVIFDRFMTEEQFGWRVEDQCPDAIRVLDTSDLHGLRYAREQATKQQTAPDLFNDIALREYAAIARCDLTLLISPVERDLLMSHFHVDPLRLHWLPFLQPKPEPNIWPAFESRQHFLFVGGYKHAPNVDAVQWLKRDIWPHIRQALPTAECHIYGPYAPPAITQLHQPATGFLIKGRVDNIRTCMSGYRVNLAPLRYGAGNKGKVIDGWATGTPTLMTSIAREGMTDLGDHPLAPQDNAADFARQAVTLHQLDQHWYAAQAAGFEALSVGTNIEVHGTALLQRLQRLQNGLEDHRHSNPLGRLLSQQQYRANEFLSRWITLKNTLT